MRFSMLVVKNLARRRARAKEVVLGSEAASKLGAGVGETVTAPTYLPLTSGSISSSASDVERSR